jgi:hypothetical protein
MPLPHSLMQKEISERLARVRTATRQKSYDALIVYGDNKAQGSLRYPTDYFPDRAGWVSLGPTETYLFEGGGLRVVQGRRKGCRFASRLLEPGIGQIPGGTLNDEYAL